MNAADGSDRAARLLLRGCRAAVLATSAADQPHTALVTPAFTRSLSAILLLSELSRHTAQLRANPRCALHVAAAAPTLSGNPQTIPRLSLTCHAAPDPRADLRRRYLAVHPYAALYADFGDFAIWLLAVTQVHAVAGFGKAWSGPAGRLAPRHPIAAPPPDDVVAGYAQRHAAAFERIGLRETGQSAAWTLVGIDPDGCDLGCADASVHVSWPASMTPGDATAGLAALVAGA